MLLLGPVEVKANGHSLPLGRQKLRALLALLALNPNQVVSTDRAIDALWGARPPPTASVALYGLVSALRKLLEPLGGVIVTKPPGYVLELQPDQIDLGRFEQLAADGRRALGAGDAETAATRLAEALVLWRGPPLQDLEFLPFVQTEIGRIGELRLAALEDRIEADLVRGRNGDLVAELEPLVAEYPLRERLRGQLMRALYRAGRQADALAAYRDARGVLVDELGLEPSDELQELERAILQHDAALTPPPGPADSAPAAGHRRGRWIALAAAIAVAAVAAALVATRDSSGGAVAILPNGVGVLEGGKVVAAGTVGASPSDVAAGGGSVWVTNTDDQTVTRVDPSTGEASQTIPVGSGPGGVAADEHGVWVANSLDGTITRIDPKANAVVDTIPVGTAPVALALAGDELWVVSRDDQTLTRLDARTGKVTGAHPRRGGPASGGGRRRRRLGGRRASQCRLPHRSAAPQGRRHQINVGNGPVSVAVGHGSVWVANNLDGTVSRIDPSRDVVAATIAVGDGPRGLAVTREGIWVSNEFDGTLRLIDPRTNKVGRTIRIGGAAGGTRKHGDATDRRRQARQHRPSRRHAARRRTGNSGPRSTRSPAHRAVLNTNDGLLGFRKVGGADGGQLVPDLAVGIPAADRRRPHLHISAAPGNPLLERPARAARRLPARDRARDPAPPRHLVLRPDHGRGALRRQARALRPLSRDRHRRPGADRDVPPARAKSRLPLRPGAPVRVRRPGEHAATRRRQAPVACHGALHGGQLRSSQPPDTRPEPSLPGVVEGRAA